MTLGAFGQSLLCSDAGRLAIAYEFTREENDMKTTAKLALACSTALIGAAASADTMNIGNYPEQRGC